MLLVAMLYVGIEIVTTFKFVGGVYYNCMYHKELCKGK